MAAQPAKTRKRDAVGQLRGLATALEVEHDRRNPDMSLDAFTRLHASVYQASTPEQRQIADDAFNLFRGQAAVSLPPVPPLPSAPAVANNESPGFRIRGNSCLFTWNSSSFSQAVRQDLWIEFLAFLGSLSFVSAWSATMELSLQSRLPGRVHLHAFVEFKHAVDWTSTESMQFKGGRPNASPTKARGDNQRSQDHSCSLFS